MEIPFYLSLQLHVIYASMDFVYNNFIDYFLIINNDHSPYFYFAKLEINLQLNYITKYVFLAFHVDKYGFY